MQHWVPHTEYKAFKFWFSPSCAILSPLEHHLTTDSQLMPNVSTPSEWITTAEAAELTGYDLTHVRYLIRKGQVEGKKFGRDWMVNRDSALAYVEKMRRLGPAKHDPWRTGARERSRED